jgi:hypothetical protein
MSAASLPPANQPPATTTSDTSVKIRIDNSVSIVWVWDKSRARRHRSLAQYARQRLQRSICLPMAPRTAALGRRRLRSIAISWVAGNCPHGGHGPSRKQGRRASESRAGRQLKPAQYAPSLKLRRTEMRARRSLVRRRVGDEVDDHRSHARNVLQNSVRHGVDVAHEVIQLVGRISVSVIRHQAVRRRITVFRLRPKAGFGGQVDLIRLTRLPGIWRSNSARARRNDEAVN